MSCYHEPYFFFGLSIRPEAQSGLNRPLPGKVVVFLQTNEYHELETVGWYLTPTRQHQGHLMCLSSSPKADCLS